LALAAGTLKDDAAWKSLESELPPNSKLRTTNTHHIQSSTKLFLAFSMPA